MACCRPTYSTDDTCGTTMHYCLDAKVSSFGGTCERVEVRVSVWRYVWACRGTCERVEVRMGV